LVSPDQTTTHPGARLEGKVALVTGAASGIGLATARALIHEGARVVLADLKGCETRAQAGSSTGMAAHGVELDVRNPQSWAHAVEQALSTFGKLDVLVNNAGIGGRGGVEDTDPASWREVMAVNLDGVFYGMRAALPALRTNETSSIINVSSIAGLVGFKGAASYSASKWGVHGLTKTAALELGGLGVRVNSIHPGSITTPLTEQLSRGIGQIPAGRVGNPEEIASLVVYLASDESRFTNGASIAVDGGETAGNNIGGRL
jgi:3alpha(or 20beta)-hydroxysteroid dehydrogenase